MPIAMEATFKALEKCLPELNKLVYALEDDLRLVKEELENAKESMQELKAQFACDIVPVIILIKVMQILQFQL